ncbi:hypothetical protein BT96DRAFT_962128 [Gymnopus androsaceus JB14]|uniref:Uncharacterized protein n=1 Tax=Gymnopus androsaceus JB14 TaxID=1447944 RepID=A0A6A4IPE5_9AGAR|nr:hypothetical protein BT96DRAFT_962128 [Gymnopus androsaceus JB14]
MKYLDICSSYREDVRGRLTNVAKAHMCMRHWILQCLITSLRRVWWTRYPSLCLGVGRWNRRSRRASRNLRGLCFGYVSACSLTLDIGSFFIRVIVRVWFRVRIVLQSFCAVNLCP